MHGFVGMSLCEFARFEDQQYYSEAPFLEATGALLESVARNMREALGSGELGENFGDTGKRNLHGETVQKMDACAHQLFCEEAQRARVFTALVSEEADAIISCRGRDRGEYLLVFDPLDGSLNVAVNGGCGSIFSVYRAVNGDVRDFQQLAEQVFAGYVFYGPATVLVCASSRGACAFTWCAARNCFVLSHPQIHIPVQGKYYSCNAANVSSWKRPLEKYICDLQSQGFSQRYSGALVTDMHRLLFCGGVFLYPADLRYPLGKLRVLYELAPMSFILQQAGGLAWSAEQPLLNSVLEKLHQRAPFYAGSPQPMQALLEYIRES